MKTLYDWCIENNREDLLKEWHPTKNGMLKPSMISAGSNKKAWWICSKGHEWQSTVNNRKNGNGCPECRKKKKI